MYHHPIRDKVIIIIIAHKVNRTAFQHQNILAFKLGFERNIEHRKHFRHQYAIIKISLRERFIMAILKQANVGPLRNINHKDNSTKIILLTSIIICYYLFCQSFFLLFTFWICKFSWTFYTFFPFCVSVKLFLPQ